MKKQILTLATIFTTYFASAQVGVGTTSPSEALDVETSDASKTAVDINNTGGGDPKINLQLNGTSTFSIGIDNSDSDKLKIGTSALETNTRLTIDASGNCGIGNTSPGAKLDVDGSAIFNESGAARDFRIESDANTHHFYVDGTNNEIGVNTSTPASTLDIQGSMGLKVTTITAATTLNQTHNVILCNTGAYTVTLPAAASNSGKVYYIKNIDAEGDDITVDGNASETIDGNTTYILSAYKQNIRIICDGSNWHILEEFGKNATNNGGDFFEFTWNPVVNPSTGETWMDRNLGAKNVAASLTDANAYGYAFQWGRAADGHQYTNSTTTATLSTTDATGHGNFITTNSGNNDWRSTQNDNLWQGVSGQNNPCPGGYRIPTLTEWTTEKDSWTSQNGAGGLSSVLKIPYAPKRTNDGTWAYAGTAGHFWTSTVSGTTSYWVYITDGNVQTGTAFNSRSFAMPIRCIKD